MERSYENNKEKKDYTILYAIQALLFGGTLMALSTFFPQGEKLNNNSLEQKTQNEVLIDSTKRDTTNYKNLINYFDCEKRENTYSPEQLDSIVKERFDKLNESKYNLKD